MDAKQFFMKVAEMRHAQKAYFDTRSKETLEKAKTLEREIDTEIKRVNEMMQLNLDL